MKPICLQFYYYLVSLLSL